MRTFMIVLAFALVLTMGCRRGQVQVTIIYDKNNETSYPYTSYGDVAKVYYTIGVKSYEESIPNHKRITISVPAKTALRASLQKITSDANGINSAMIDVFYTADRNNPTWTL